MEDYPDIYDSFKVQDRLEPRFWGPDMKLAPEIRRRLLRIVKDFMYNMYIQWMDVEDIVITGSIANYNWSDYSDIDVHIETKFGDYDMDQDSLATLFNSVKDEWNRKHEGLTIYGYPLELYIEDYDGYSGSSGVYSLITDSWIKEPQEFDVDIDFDAVAPRVDKYMNVIDKLARRVKVTEHPGYISDKCLTLFKFLVKKRHEGLGSEKKEMSDWNIVWKTLRRLKYIERIWDVIYEAYDRKNSIS